MKRDEFMAKLDGFDGERLKRALWNLYWRGAATMRERIEGELDPGEIVRRSAAKAVVDPEQVLDAVEDFVTLVRSGAYMGGDRRVAPRERTRWRFTFQSLAADAQGALRNEENLKPGATALERLIDLGCSMRDFDYVHSEDAVEAARFVVSDAVTALWTALLARYGFAGFAQRAAPQLIRWESRHGWTRHGWGEVAKKEVSLATVLGSMLVIPDTWIGFADHYLAALDKVAGDEQTKPTQRYGHPTDRSRRVRAGALAEWHDLLLRKLLTYEADDRLERLIHHPALAGPELGLMQARLAHHRGDLQGARTLVEGGLRELPGHQELLKFALEIQAPLSARAQQLVKERGLR
jgi:hypothetical protein